MTDRVRWLYEGAEFEADENTHRWESMPRPDDPVLLAAMALIDKYGMHSEIMVVPEEIVECMEVAFASLKPPPPPPDRCYQCGMTDEDSFREYGMPITDVKVVVAYGEEGFSNIEKHVCGEHLAWIQDEFRRLGFVSHHHGSTTLLEDQDCPGYTNMHACPTPRGYGEAEDPDE